MCGRCWLEGDIELGNAPDRDCDCRANRVSESVPMHTDAVDSIVQAVKGEPACIVRDRSPLLICGCICGDDASLGHNSTRIVGNRSGEFTRDTRTLSTHLDV